MNDVTGECEIQHACRALINYGYTLNTGGYNLKTYNDNTYDSMK